MLKTGVVWFKRDFRLVDHKPLQSALSENDQVVLLYVVEPDLWHEPDLSARQFTFLEGCVNHLQTTLQTYGVNLAIRVGDVVGVLSELSRQFNINGLYSHQETWNMWTYRRDKRVKSWCKKNHVTWHEPMQHGVIRCLASRDSWASGWHQFMNEPILSQPDAIKALQVHSEQWPSIKSLGLEMDDCPGAQIGGRDKGLALLQSFLNDRGRFYASSMSSPLSGASACSRLSPYLAFGCLSMREVYKATRKRQKELVTLSEDVRQYWPRALNAFASRLRWHCHFIQKLEDEPSIEFRHMHSAYDGIRTGAVDQQRLKAWQEGLTGYPMVDACMRYLKYHGWINFRMRAMLMSFASYHLWLNWRHTAPYLASLFVDYEPGIHYSQVQMQSGTTGINTMRIYNPIKQGIDQDPKGVFIKKWVPELVHVPVAFIHTPWLYDGDISSYPDPIVDEKSARNYAQKQLYAIRKTDEHRSEANRVVKKHASKRRKPPNPYTQKDLFGDTD